MLAFLFPFFRLSRDCRSFFRLRSFSQRRSNPLIFSGRLLRDPNQSFFFFPEWQSPASFFIPVRTSSVPPPPPPPSSLLGPLKTEAIRLEVGRHDGSSNAGLPVLRLHFSQTEMNKASRLLLHRIFFLPPLPTSHEARSHPGRLFPLPSGRGRI